LVWDQEVGGSNPPTPTSRRDVTVSMSVQNSRVAGYVAIVRIVAIVGMALALALGIFLVMGGLWLAGGIAFVGFLPFFLLMRLLERSEQAHGKPPSP
jgi:ABC-type multidrug transport system fused ATPase/permease subunit